MNTKQQRRPLSWQLPVALALFAAVCLPFAAQSLVAQTQPTSTGDAVTTSTTVDEAGNRETKVVASKTLLQVIHDGGALMIPIGICSIVLLVFVFERAISLRKGRIIPRPFVKRFLQQLREGQLDADTAMELCEKNKSPVADVFAAAIQKWNRPSVEIEQAIIDSGERVTNGLRKYLRLINGVATVTPLLGLLGTVLGMIHAFDAIGSVDQSIRPETVIATGISQALLTTAAGLSIAIPALIAYLFFVGRVDQLVVEIDSLGQQIVSIIASDAWRPTSTGDDANKARKSKSKRQAA